MKSVFEKNDLLFPAITCAAVLLAAAAMAKAIPAALSLGVIIFLLFAQFVTATLYTRKASRLVESSIRKIQQVMEPHSHDELPDCESALNKFIEKYSAMKEKGLAKLEALNRLQQVHNSVIETMRSGFLLTNASGTILVANRAACENLGLPRTRLESEKFQDLKGWEEMDLQKVFNDVVSRRRPYINNRVFSGVYREDKEVVFNVNIRPLERDNGELLGVVATFDFLTETVSLEESLLKMNWELQRANQVKSEFLSVVSHELRTPLTLIKMYSGMLADGRLGPLTEKQSSALEVMNRRCLNLNDMINDLLDLGRIESGRMEMNFGKLDIDKIVDQAVDNFAAKADEKNIEIVRRAHAAGQTDTYADSERIMQVLNNLFENAIKFTDSGGRIIVSTLRQNSEARPDREEIVVQVQDTGCGIEAQHFEKIFQKFYQVDASDSRKYEGSGLGLAIVREIVDMHGGRVWVESEFGRGAAFYFAIPVWTEDQVIEPLPQEPAMSASPQSGEGDSGPGANNRRFRHIWVVDDDEDFLIMMKELLELDGYEAMTLKNGAEALALIAAENKPEAILLDVSMPEINGLELCSALKGMKVTMDIPVVLLTGAGQPGQIQEGYMAGADNYLVKPFQRDQLKNILEDLAVKKAAAKAFGRK